MKLTIKKIIKEEVEITFPHFRKDGNLFYSAFFSENELIRVTVNQYIPTAIDMFKGDYDDWLLNGKESTPEEFAAAYNKAKNEIDNVCKRLKL